MKPWLPSNRTESTRLHPQLKPSFHKLYAGPGYPTTKRPAPRSDWNLDPAFVRQYGSLFGWYAKPWDQGISLMDFLRQPNARLPYQPGIEDLFQQIYRVVRERELQPERPPQYECILQSQPIHQGNHGDDILRLPLGVTLRPG